LLLVAVEGAIHKIESDGPMSARKFLCESTGAGLHLAAFIFHSLCFDEVIAYLCLIDGRPFSSLDFRCLEVHTEEGCGVKCGSYAHKKYISVIE
jgi:hypothetical protein